MPTGLTAIIGEKENVKLKDFAMMCARSFGALIDMKDEPIDAPIPEKFEVHSYYKDELDKAQKRYDEFMAFTDDEKVAYLEHTYIEMVERYKTEAEQVDAKNDILCQRYNVMLQKVLKWTPPTPDHENLRQFMIQQIQDSIKWDSQKYEPRIPDKAEWCDIHEHIAYLKKNVELSQEHYNKKIAEYERKNKWLADLRESLKDCD